MKELITNLWKRSIVRYVFFGGLSYIIEIAIIQISLITLHDNIVSVTIGFWSGLVIAFLLQKMFAFQDGQKKPKRLLSQMLAYGLLIVINYLFTLGVVWALGNTIMGVIGARTIALVITTVWNFFAYKYVIFKTASS